MESETVNDDRREQEAEVAQLIAEADELKRRSDQNQWGWGDWALRCEPVTYTGSGGSTGRVQSRLQRVLEDRHKAWGDNSPTIRTVDTWRLVSDKFPPSSRNYGAFSVYRVALAAGWGPDDMANVPSDSPNGRWSNATIQEAIEHGKEIYCSECGEPTGKKARNLESARGLSKSTLCQECATAEPEPAKVAATATAFTSRKPVTPPPPNAGSEETQEPTPPEPKPRPSYMVVPETPEQAQARRDRGREIHKEVQHKAMLNGRPGSNNHLLTNELRKLSARLGDFADSYTARDAAFQIPDRQLQWFCDIDRAEWLLEFFRECDKRRRAEVPELEPRSPRSEGASRYRDV
jgi:hypothetical protein